MARALRYRTFVMAYVIASTSIDVNDGACQEACPVECIYEGGQISNLTSASIAGSACRSVRSTRFMRAKICRGASAHSSAPMPSSLGRRSPVGARPAAPTRPTSGAIDHPLVAIRAK
jgi:hypothetical protein